MATETPRAAELRGDMAAGAALVGIAFGVLALLGGSVVAAFGESTEAGVVVACLSSVVIIACTFAGAQGLETGFGAAFGVLIATVCAVVVEIGIGGAILLPLLIIPACATAVGAALGAARMYAIANRH